MPIKVKIQLVNLDWGQSIYVINDPDQYPHHLVGIITLPGGAMKYLLMYFTDMEPKPFYDFECTTEPGEKRQIISEEDKEED